EPLDVGDDAAAGLEREPAHTGRPAVEREELARRQELRAGRRRAQVAHAAALAIGGLVNVAPEHATDLRVAVDDLEERRRVAQADAVEPRAAHRQGLMMHAEEDVPAGAPRERVLERAEAQRTQAAR